MRQPPVNPFQFTLFEQAGKLADPAQFDHATVVAYDPAAPAFGEPGSADLVVTFRNVHNWRGSGQAQGMFEGFFKVLRPGGVLGVVEHRAAAAVADDDRSGYVGQDQVIAMAEAAGFRLDATSEANANPRCFARAPHDEAVGKLVAAIREHRPHVLITYGDDQRGYPHPDHLRVHDISLPAFDLAGDPTYRPELGEPFAAGDRPRGGTGHPRPSTREAARSGVP